MDIDDADPAVAGLHQLISTLSRQLNVTRNEVLSLHSLKEKKETLLQTGYGVLDQHCASTLSGTDLYQYQSETQNNYQAVVTGSVPCPSGWKVSIQVQGSADLLEKTNVTIAAILPGNDSSGCSIKQLEETAGETGTAEASSGVQASAVIQLQGFPSQGLHSSSTGFLEIYAFLTSSAGTISAVVHAGRVTLDSAAWLRSFSSLDSMTEKEKVRQSTAGWPHAAHFLVQMMPQHRDNLDSNWLDALLVQHIGCAPTTSTTGVGGIGGGGRWHLGTAAEVHSQQQPTSTHSTNDIVPISIYGESMQLVWAIQEEVKRNLEKKVGAAEDGDLGKLLPKWTQKPISCINSAEKHTNNTLETRNTLKSSVDALIFELDALTTWTEALKKQHAAGNSMLVRQEVMVAQAAAVDAMVYTDTTAIVVSRTHHA
jgi:hypothetical protein